MAQMMVMNPVFENPMNLCAYPTVDFGNQIKGVKLKATGSGSKSKQCLAESA